MALDLTTLKAHCNVTEATDDAVLTRLLAAATAHFEQQVGYVLDDEDELPDGVPADIEQAVLMIAAHWYENREATLVGVVAQELPIGVADVIRNRRVYSYA